MYGFGVSKMRFGLESTAELLRRLGNPQNDITAIHVAGSDGKGSTCSMIHSVLLKAGVSVGAYTSPHLMRFNERISVNGKDIGDDELEALMEKVRPVADRMASEGMECTFFEVATALAFLHFSSNGVKYAVIETGMGGRLDATNVLIPEVTAITHISLEHSEILGDTKEKIAFEKAGIIKHNVPVITANTGSVLDVIRDAAKKRDAPLIAIPPDDVKILSFNDGRVEMEYHGRTYRIGIPGSCQAENAAVAIECIRSLNIGITEENISEGLKDVVWRGRMEHLVDEDIIIDVSHTAAGAEILADDILKTYGKVILIIGMFSDKSADEICRSMARAASKIVVTSPDSERAMPAERLAEIMRKYSNGVSLKKNVGEAIDSVIGKGTILITGSLNMAGEAMSWLRRT
jgi:dihydrofolate synthase/folylpolyglutamate synthase